MRWVLVSVSKLRRGRVGRIADRLARIGISGFFQDASQERDGQDGEDGVAVVRVIRASRSHSIALARHREPKCEHEELFCSYAFDRTAFAQARLWLQEDLAESRVVVIEEISKLEVAGSGHAQTLEWLKGAVSDRLCVLGIRSDQLPYVFDRFSLPDPLLTLEADEGELEEETAIATMVKLASPADGAKTRLVGGVNWQARWTEMFDRERKQEARCAGAVARTDATSDPTKDPWATRAARFAERAATEPADPFIEQVLAHQLRPEDVVMDIGAGTGRHVRVLSSRVRRVIAVEPSNAMRTRLLEMVQREGLDNVEVWAEPWPLDRPDCADVVLGAHVLYGVRDAGAFLTSMTLAARRLCALCHDVFAPKTIFSQVWGAVHGEKKHEVAAGLEILALLFQLGERPSLTALPVQMRTLRYRNQQDALEELYVRLQLPRSDETDSRVRASLDHCLERAGDTLTLSGLKGDVAITWTPARLAPQPGPVGW